MIRLPPYGCLQRTIEWGLRGGHMDSVMGGGKFLEFGEIFLLKPLNKEIYYVEQMFLY